MRRLWCRIVGHQRVRVITAATLVASSAWTAEYRSTAWRYECRRCHSELVDPAKLMSDG